MGNGGQFSKQFGQGCVEKQLVLYCAQKRMPDRARAECNGTNSWSRVNKASVSSSYCADFHQTLACMLPKGKQNRLNKKRECNAPKAREGRSFAHILPTRLKLESSSSRVELEFWAKPPNFWAWCYQLCVTPKHGSYLTVRRNQYGLAFDYVRFAP